MSTDPAAFLEAELGRVEELARAAGGKDGWWVIAPRYSDPRFANGVPPTPEDCAILNVHTGPVVYVEVGDAVDKEKRMGEAMLIQANNPAAVLRRVKADRALLADLLAERHLVVDGDWWFTCAAATEERDGGENCDDDRRGGSCDCGRDTRVERRVRLLAEGYGWVAS